MSTLPLRIALRYLKSKKTHNAVNVISIISICGVVVTTAAMVCVLSVFNGFRGLIMGKLAMLDPQISITATLGKTISDADSVVSAVKAIDGVQEAMPVITDNALAVFTDYQMVVRLKGVPDNYDKINDIDSVIVDGEFQLHDQVSSYAVLGVEPALQLHVRPGYLRMLQLYAPQRVGQINLAAPTDAFRVDSVFISGVFQLQQNKYDKDMVFVPIDLTRELFDYDTQASAVEIKLSPTADETLVMSQISTALGTSYSVKNRLMQQAEAYKLVNIEKWIAFLLLAFIMVIATFNVISTLSLLIIEKDESIRTFRSMGASDKQITHIFVAEGWLIALVGAVGGIASGVVLCLCQQAFGWLKLSGDASMVIVQAYPVKVLWPDLVVVFLFVAAIGLMTSVITSLTMKRRLNF